MGISLQRFKKQSEFKRNNKNIGRLAQLVQSIWFTPRGSGVRIPHRPLKKSFDYSDDFFYFYRMFHCYILYSEKLDKYYVGSTSDLEGRVQRHNTSNKGFTSTGKPWVIKLTEQFEAKGHALKREMQLKSWKSRSVLEGLIRKGSGHPD